MRILIVSLYYAPSRDANSPIVTALAEGLAAKGHDVRVLTAIPHYRQSEVEAPYAGKLAQSRPEGGVLVTRTWVPAGKLPAWADRVGTYLAFHLASTAWGMAGAARDVILTLSPPVTNAAVCLALARVKGAPFVYVAQDFYPDIAAAVGAMRGEVVLRVARAAARQIYRQAARVVVVSPAMRERMAGIGVSPARIDLIENFVDTARLSPGPRHEELARAMGWRGRFVVLLAGNIGWSQPTEPILEAAAILGADEDIHFAFVASGAWARRAQGVARERGLANVSFHELLPGRQVPDLYRCADVCLVTLRRGLDGLSFPSRIYSAMAVARPIIACVEQGSDVAGFVSRTGCGEVAPPDDPQDLASAIRRLRDEPEVGRAMGRRGREYVCRHHSVDAAVEAYERCLGAAVAGHGAGNSPLASGGNLC